MKEFTILLFLSYYFFVQNCNANDYKEYIPKYIWDIERGDTREKICNDKNSNVLLKTRMLKIENKKLLYMTIENISEVNFKLRYSSAYNFDIIIKQPDGNRLFLDNDDTFSFSIIKPYEIATYNSYELMEEYGNKYIKQIGNYEFSWKVYQNDDRTGKEWTSNKLIVNIDEKGEVTLIDDLPSPDWTDEQITEHLQKYENLENEKHIAKTFTEKIKNLNFNKPKEDSDKAISEPQKNETSKSKIFIIFGVLFTIILGGCLVCEHKKKKKNRKQEEK